MVTVRPFKALRPSQEMAKIISSSPYDVVSREEVKDILKTNSESFLKITRSDGLLDDKTSPYDTSVYELAKKNFLDFKNRKILSEDLNNSFYIYSQISQTHTQTGFVCCTSVEEYINDHIKKHEKTREDKEEDRTKHIDSLNAQLEPVFLTFKPDNEIDSFMNKIINNTNPVLNFTSNDNITHQLWIISEKSLINELITLFSKVENLYIADGHHRAASAVRVCLNRQKLNSSHSGNEEYNFFLSVLFPSKELKILPYNRTIKDLNGLTEIQFLKKLEDMFTVEPLKDTDKQPKEPHIIHMYLNNTWYKLKARLEKISLQNVIESLDVSILQTHVLNNILHIKDPRTDKRIDFIGGINTVDELEKTVNSGKMKLAFALFPTSIESLIQIADENKLMPPKSTWFEPKLRSGLFIHSL